MPGPVLDKLDLGRLDMYLDSLSRSRGGKPPLLEHLLSVGSGKTLSLAADHRYIYAGSQEDRNGIAVFSQSNYAKVTNLIGHSGAVLVLLLVPEKQWLISGGSDGSVRIWSTETLALVMTIRPSFDTSGDIYSLAWDGRNRGTLYFGCQNTDIEFINLASVQNGSPPMNPRLENTPDPATHSALVTLQRSRSGRHGPNPFFDMAPSSLPSSCIAATASPHPVLAEIPIATDVPSGSKDAHTISVPATNVISSAHYGYIYCMFMMERPEGERWLVSGSGDSDIKVWLCKPQGGVHLLHTFDNLPGAVLSVAARDSLLFGGCQDGQVKVFDLETRSCIRTIIGHETDILTMATAGTDLFTASANGHILRFNDSFDCTASFDAHRGPILDMIALDDPNVSSKSGRVQLVTGGHDSWIKLWRAEHHQDSLGNSSEDSSAQPIDGDVMLYALAKLVAVPTVSGDEAHREDCRKGAHLLKKLLTQMGAEAAVIPTVEGKNPIVKAHFHATSGKPRKRILFYGHYDVQPAEEENWESDPFELTGRNGYLYGRGVSDNKGPIIALACAATSLRQSRCLDVDVILLIEGEEESGSSGFNTTLQNLKESVGPIDVVLVSNSSWIGESEPCVVFGMRGVIYASLAVSSDNVDAHSGVDGGVVSEPMLAMVSLLNSLNQGYRKLSGFGNQVQTLISGEDELYEEVAKATGTPKAALLKKWREPTFSIANIVASGPSNNTIIPRTVTANVSFRLVPDQDVDIVVESVAQFCRDQFAQHRDLSLEFKVTHRAKWWLASIENKYFAALEQSVEKVWGRAPLKIREGGSIPAIPVLESTFNAPCVHLPLGQHSSAAHLANERLQLTNLRNGKRVIEEYLQAIGRL